MLTKLQIQGGVGSIERKGKHIKLVSAESQVQLEAMSPGGKVLLKTEMRSPMAVELDQDAVRLNFYGADQLIEIWYSEFPLDYLQLVTISASRATVKSHTLYSGEVPLTTKQANRKSVKIRPFGGDVYVGEAGQRSEGWLIPDGEAEVFETMGDLSVYRTMADIKLQGVATAVDLPTIPMGGSLGNFGYAHFKGKHYVGLASAGYKFADGDTSATTIDGGVYFTFAGRLYHAFAGGSGAVLRVSDDGEVFEVNAYFPGAAPQMQKIHAKWGSISTTYSQSGYFYQIDPGREELESVAAIDASYRQYVTSPVGIFGLVAGTGAGKGVFKRNTDGSWTQVYFNTTAALEIKLLQTNPETGKLVALLNDKFHVSDDGVNWTQVSTTTISASNHNYVFLGGDSFLGWNGALKHYKKMGDEFGGGYVEQTATLWSDTFPADFSVDPEQHQVFGCEQTGTAGKKFKKFTIPGIAAAEPIRVQTMELLF